MEQLYVEVLYTIRHKLGAHSAKYPHHFKEDLVHYAQVAFGVGHEYHRKCNAIASEEKVKKNGVPKPTLSDLPDRHPTKRTRRQFNSRLSYKLTSSFPTDGND